MSTAVLSRGPTARDLAANALILGVAAIAWFGWAQERPPAGWSVPLGVGSGLGLVVAAFAGVAVWRRRRGDSAMTEPEGRRTYYRTVGVECAAIVVGVVGLGLAGQSDYLAPWILFVVGAHFLPLSGLFDIRSLVPAGLLLVVASAVAVVAGLVWTVTPSAVAGGVGGSVLLVVAVLSLVRR
ncbi:MAG TPA: hypothetical protein VHF06_36040 [Pseudonocardiaceae bacterium]|jgi:hypothetical protein|nr:hypothetical protein [Pseudonocardiaceae bacterium]